MEGGVELPNHVGPFLASFRYLVELLLHVGREVVVEYLLEMFIEIIIDNHADVGRRQLGLLPAGGFRKLFRADFALFEPDEPVAAFGSLLVLLDDVSPVDDGGDGRRIGGRPADAELFEPSHQRCLAVTERGLGEAFRG